MWLIRSIHLLTVIASAVNAITVNPPNPLKNGTFTLTATATGATLTWVKDTITLTACFVTANTCAFPTPSSMPNAIITVDSVTSVSTITISSATQALNGGVYEATNAISKTVIISTLPSSIQWESQPVNGSSLTTGTWIAKTPCVFSETSISIDFTIYVDGVQHSMQRVSTYSESDACEAPEKVVLAQLVLESKSYSNKRVYIVANASHNLFPNEPYVESVPSNEVIFKGQSTDSCDFNYWYCIGYILLAVFIASGICTLVVVLWWKIKRKEIKAKSILCWLAEHRFCCCAQKIKRFCEKYKNTRIWGVHVLLLADVFVIGMVVSIVVWLFAVIVVILTCCACKELLVKFAVAGISFVLSLFASPIWTAIVLIVYRIASCCKNNGYHKLCSKYKTKEAGDNVNLLEKRAHEFKKIKSIDLTKDREKVSSDEYEVGMTACPSLTLKMVSLDQSGKYECTISYDLAQKEVHQLNLLVTPKQYEVKMGDKKTLLKFLKKLKDIEDVTWTHNYETIPADTCFYKGGTRSNPSLTVKYCSTSDSGLYICNIRTKQGSKRFSAQLNITVADEIKVDVGGKKTLLENLISNNKDFEDVKWYHKRQPIPHNCDFSYDAEPQNRSALTINLVTAKMEGQYKCIVKSTKNAEIKVFKVQVKVLDNYTVDSGKNIDLLKDLSSYHGIKQISWVLNGKPLKLAENPSYIGGTKDRPVLTVYCATKEESGKYKCTLEFESQPTKELNFKLDVNEQWQVDSGDSIVLLDKLESSFDGTSVVWTHKKKPVKCFHKGGTDQCPTLTIPVVSLEDSGEYECKLTLQHGKIRLYRFVLKVNVQKIKKKVGDKVILLQNLTSAGTIQGINWYKNGRKVPASSDLKYQGGVNQSPGLLVGSLRQDDSGRYECDLIITESHIKLHIPVDLTVEQKENSTRLGPVIRNNRVRASTENNQSWTEEEQ